MTPLEIREMEDNLRPWATRLIREHWGSDVIVSRGRIHRAADLPGFVALLDGRPIGLLTYHREGDQCEIVSLNSLRERSGIGSRLIARAAEMAAAAACRRLWVITTNDNLAALRFYQRRGFRLAALHAGAMAQSRRLKPGIPEVGIDGIPLRDEIELEMVL